MSESGSEENQQVVSPADTSTQSAPVAHVEPSFNPEFILVLRDYFPLETIREQMRITPKGLFVSHTFRDRLIEGYQAWLAAEGLPPAARTNEKILRRIFASPTPALYYLVEGKTTLPGYLAVAPIQQPQRYQLPYFLGSLADSRTMLHVQDPIFSELTWLRAVQGAQGLEVLIKTDDSELIVSTAAIKEFVERAEYSSRTMREFPNIKDSLAESLRALASMIRKSKPLTGDKASSILPHHLSKQKGLKIRTLANVRFIFNQKLQLLTVLELKAKNLSHFVWREMITSRKNGERQIGIFSLASEKDRAIGIFNMRGKKIRLATHALAGFVEHVGESPEKRDKFPGNYTVRDCFEKFSILFQTAQPIEAKLISSFVGDFRQRGTRFSVNGPWIFVIGPDGTLSHCLARHARPRERRRR